MSTVEASVLLNLPLGWKKKLSEKWLRLPASVGSIKSSSFLAVLE